MNDPHKDECPGGAGQNEEKTKVTGEHSTLEINQSEMFDLPEFYPILPVVNSAAAQALDDLCAGDLTQLDWLQSGNGWRLAAAVKELDYLGWEPQSIRVKCNGWGRKIARYSLSAKAKQAAYTMRQGGAA